MIGTNGTSNDTVDDAIVTGGIGGDGPQPPIVEGAGPETPVKPEWHAGKPGFVARRLIRIAGVDHHLGSTMPPDEQQQMKRVGAALVFGVTFQTICFATALNVAFGFQAWTIPVALILGGIMWNLDSKFVGADWAAQGRAFCRAYGLIPPGDWRDQCKRLGTFVVRWTVSFFIAASLAICLLLKMFEPSIERHWAEENRAQNRPIVEAVTARYEALVADRVKQIGLSDQKIEALTVERARLATGTTPATADLDREIASRLDRIKALEADKDKATAAAAAHQRDVRAETYGIRLNDGNTGHPGNGNYHDFHADVVKDELARARARDADIDAEGKALAELRRERAGILENLSATVRAQIAAVEGRLNEEVRSRAAPDAEYRQLQDGGEEWIAAHTREASGYVPLPTGILAKLEALAAIMTSNWLIASMVLFSKVLVMLLESAGPVAKVAFTAPGLYQMLLALRLHDAAEFETDRRLRWEHWRVVTRGRNHEAIDAFNALKRRRSTEARARDALHKIMEKAPWLH